MSIRIIIKQAIWIVIFVIQGYSIDFAFANDGVIGAWQYQNYDAYTHIKEDGTAFQCRLDKDYIYRANGVWNSELFVRWEIIKTTKSGIIVDNPISPDFSWGLEKMTFEAPDSNTFIGKFGSFELSRISLTDIPKACYDEYNEDDT